MKNRLIDIFPFAKKKFISSNATTTYKQACSCTRRKLDSFGSILKQQAEYAGKVLTFLTINNGSVYYISQMI